MNEDLRSLLDSLVDNAVEEYFLESQFIDQISQMTKEQRHEVALYIHDRLVMSEIEPFVHASFERVERYINIRGQIGNIQAESEKLEAQINELLTELDDEGIIAQSEHLNG